MPRGLPFQVTNAAMKSLLQYDWPGNIRELENCVERAVALGDSKKIDVGDLPPAIRSFAVDGGSFRDDKWADLHDRPRRH